MSTERADARDTVGQLKPQLTSEKKKEKKKKRVERSARSIAVVYTDADIEAVLDRDPQRQQARLTEFSSEPWSGSNRTASLDLLTVNANQSPFVHSSLSSLANQLPDEQVHLDTPSISLEHLQPDTKLEVNVKYPKSSGVEGHNSGGTVALAGVVVEHIVDAGDAGLIAESTRVKQSQLQRKNVRRKLRAASRSDVELDIDGSIETPLLDGLITVTDPRTSTVRLDSILCTSGIGDKHSLNKLSLDSDRLRSISRQQDSVVVNMEVGRHRGRGVVGLEAAVLDSDPWSLFGMKLSSLCRELLQGKQVVREAPKDSHKSKKRREVRGEAKKEKAMRPNSLFSEKGHPGRIASLSNTSEEHSQSENLIEVVSDSKDFRHRNTSSKSADFEKANVFKVNFEPGKQESDAVAELWRRLGHGDCTKVDNAAATRSDYSKDVWVRIDRPLRKDFSELAGVPSDVGHLSAAPAVSRKSGEKQQETPAVQNQVAKQEKTKPKKDKAVSKAAESGTKQRLAAKLEPVSNDASLVGEDARERAGSGFLTAEQAEVNILQLNEKLSAKESLKNDQSKQVVTDSPLVQLPTEKKPSAKVKLIKDENADVKKQRGKDVSIGVTSLITDKINLSKKTKIATSESPTVNSIIPIIQTKPTDKPKVVHKSDRKDTRAPNSINLSKEKLSAEDPIEFIELAGSIMERQACPASAVTDEEVTTSYQRRSMWDLDAQSSLTNVRRNYELSGSRVYAAPFIQINSTNLTNTVIPTNGTIPYLMSGSRSLSSSHTNLYETQRTVTSSHVTTSTVSKHQTRTVHHETSKEQSGSSMSKRLENSLSNSTEGRPPLASGDSAKRKESRKNGSLSGELDGERRGARPRQRKDDTKLDAWKKIQYQARSMLDLSSGSNGVPEIGSRSLADEGGSSGRSSVEGTRGRRTRSAVREVQTKRRSRSTSQARRRTFETECEVLTTRTTTEEYLLPPRQLLPSGSSMSPQTTALPMPPLPSPPPPPFPTTPDTPPVALNLSDVVPPRDAFTQTDDLPQIQLHEVESPVFLTPASSPPPVSRPLTPPPRLSDACAQTDDAPLPLARPPLESPPLYVLAPVSAPRLDVQDGRRVVVPKIAAIVECLKFVSIAEGEESRTDRLGGRRPHAPARDDIPIMEATVYEFGEMLRVYRT